MKAVLQFVLYSCRNLQALLWQYLLRVFAEHCLQDFAQKPHMNLTYSHFIDFFEGDRKYQEGRREVFSIFAEKLPCNMSNGIGYFGSAFIYENELDVPDELGVTYIAGN